MKDLNNHLNHIFSMLEANTLRAVIGEIQTVNTPEYLRLIIQALDFGVSMEEKIQILQQILVKERIVAERLIQTQLSGILNEPSP